MLLLLAFPSTTRGAMPCAFRHAVTHDCGTSALNAGRAPVAVRDRPLHSPCHKWQSYSVPAGADASADASADADADAPV